MFLAVTAGLSGRIDDLFQVCREWERSSRSILAGVLQLGDLPLRHDFSRGRSRRTGSAVSGLVHRRRVPDYPIVFLAGEQDDVSILHRFTTSPAPIPGEPLPGGLALPQSQHTEGLSYLAAGSVISVEGRGESVLVAGISAFGISPAGALPDRGTAARSTAARSTAARSTAARGTPGRGTPTPSRRTEIRRLLALPPQSVPILISHDSPESVLAAQDSGRPGPDAESSHDPRQAPHPGALLLKVLDAIQPEVTFYGHASRMSVTRRGTTTLVSLPPCRATGDAPLVVFLNTQDWSVRSSL